MDFGTASARLKKQLMFSMARQLGQDVCFRCACHIETVEEFSVEHKLPWEGVSAELFWDLSNIAFSHLKCNTASGRRPNKVYADAREKSRKGFKRYYERNKDAVLARRAAAKKQKCTQTGQ